jgi:hypothetical protein
MRRFLLKVVCGLVPVTIAACYGAMMDYGTLEGEVIDRETRQPVEGISVTCERGGQEVGAAASGADGTFTAYLSNQCTVAVFEDLDGESNGGSYDTIRAPYSPTMKVALTRR